MSSITEDRARALFVSDKAINKKTLRPPPLKTESGSVVRVEPMLFEGKVMKIVMHPALWNSLGLDNSRSYTVALCGFYLGRGVEEVRELIRRPVDDADVSFLIETAVFCGLDLSSDHIRKASDDNG